MSDSIHVNQADVNKIVTKVSSLVGREQKIIRQKVTAITNIVWTTAHARRPKISVQQQKKLGRNPKGYRVSDPGAEFGVPVQTGSLQVAIKKEVTDNGKTTIGRIFVDPSASNSKTGVSVMKYAKIMEFGSSKIQKRPYMRPAILLNREWAKRVWRTKQTGEGGLNTG